MEEVTIDMNDPVMVGLVENLRKASAQFDWCEEHDGLESFSHADNESFGGMSTENCPNEPHWHCEQCLKLTQVG